MGLDAGTLVTALVAVCAVLAALLTLTWAQNRSEPAFGGWTISFVLFAAAAAVLSARDWLPGLLAVDIANALRLLGYGVAWQAARYFTRQKGNWALALAPAVLWSAACGFSLFELDIRQRILVSSPVVAAYSFAVAGELWRASLHNQWIARLAAALVATHGAVFIARFAIALTSADQGAEIGIGIAGPLHPIAILETLVASVALAFLLLSATKEAIGQRDREAALLDPLTGVSNRRGFEAEVARMLARAGRAGGPTALILIDLDRFKAVNDSWGHPAGDRLLQAFTEAVALELRTGDILGRLGGDEFAVALADTRIDEALVLAERIRRAVAAMRVRSTELEIGTTVSIGVASRRDAETFDALFTEADGALYRAKARGANRVEFASAGPPSRHEGPIRRVA